MSPSPTPFPTATLLAPPRPTLLLPARKRALGKAKHRLDLERRRAATASHSAKAGPSLHPDAPLTIGFHVNWDDASMSSLRQNLASLDVLIPEWLHLAGADGSIALDD